MFRFCWLRESRCFGDENENWWEESLFCGKMFDVRNIYFYDRYFSNGLEGNSVRYDIFFFVCCGLFEECNFLFKIYFL